MMLDDMKIAKVRLQIVRQSFLPIMGLHNLNITLKAVGRPHRH